MSLSMPRAPSPSPRYSPALQASPAPFLSPQLIADYHHHHQQQQPQRPLARRVHSLQNPSRPAPYPFSSPPSPTNSINGDGSHGGKTPKRPGAPHRSHSFCATGPNSTFALASTNTSSHLSSDKRKLVAPPLERTLSSIGSKGNTSPPNQQMQRPFPGALDLSVDARTPILRPQASPTRSSRSVLGSIDGLLDQVQEYHRPRTTPTPLALPPAPTSIPTILISPSLTPPRPSLATYRTSSSSSTSTISSRSSSYTIVTPLGDPSTPRQVLFHSLAIEEDEDDEQGPGFEGKSVADTDTTVHTMTGAVDHLSL